MAISKVNFNSLNVTPSASKFLMWDSDADALQASDVGGNLKLLSTQTASSSATISFASDIDSTYKEYIFKFINVHPATDNTHFTVNFRDGGTDYDATKTTNCFRAQHTEDDGTTDLSYKAGLDLAQSTAFLDIVDNVGNANDEGSSGTLHLFDPSNTTFVKHFLITTSSSNYEDQIFNPYVAGYCNTTSAIDGVQFKMSSGNIDAGVIKLYGVS